MVGRQIGLFIAGDVRLHREGLALQLEAFSKLDDVVRLKILGTGLLNDALQLLRTSAADVILLDTLKLEVPSVVRTLRAADPELRIVALGVREVESEVLACAAAGVDGYVRTDADISDLITVIESVMRGELVCSPKVAASLYHSISALGTNSSVSLTSRELEVIELMNRGLSNKEISLRLRIETCTAKNHVQNILHKLGVHRRGQAVAKVRSSIGHRFS
jgi:two-component system, NarL family, nitrate/nitrite response regulator NarL